MGEKGVHVAGVEQCFWCVFSWGGSCRVCPYLQLDSKRNAESQLSEANNDPACKPAILGLKPAVVILPPDDPA